MLDVILLLSSIQLNHTVFQSWVLSCFGISISLILYQNRIIINQPCEKMEYAEWQWQNVYNRKIQLFLASVILSIDSDNKQCIILFPNVLWIPLIVLSVRYDISRKWWRFRRKIDSKSYGLLFRCLNPRSLTWHWNTVLTNTTCY